MSVSIASKTCLTIIYDGTFDGIYKNKIIYVYIKQ